MARAREVLGEPFRKVVDEALVEAHDRLRREPGNREAKVDFVTIYHGSCARRWRRTPRWPSSCARG